MARELLGSRDLDSVEQAEMNEVRDLMSVVNQDPPFTEEAKEAFRVAVIGCGAAFAMKKRYILEDDERIGLLNALRVLVASLKVN